MKIDHIALQVDNIRESVQYYNTMYNSTTIYEDDTWAFLQFDNIKLALVVEDEHPYHIAFVAENIDSDKTVKHRDGSESYYLKDPSGNTIEIIKYKEYKQL